MLGQPVTELIARQRHRIRLGDAFLSRIHQLLGLRDGYRASLKRLLNGIWSARSCTGLEDWSAADSRFNGASDTRKMLQTRRVDYGRPSDGG